MAASLGQRRRLRNRPPASRTGATEFRSQAMTGYIAIGVIVLFIVVLGALNLYEFGRLD
jgi:hypothetical protein